MSGLKGLRQLVANLRELKRAARSIAGAAAGAGLRTMQDAARAASPGTIGQEVGVRRTAGRHTVGGKVGLDVGRARPNSHGRFLTLGTKFIQARRFIRTAFETAVPRVASAMRRAARRRFNNITKG